MDKAETHAAGIPLAPNLNPEREPENRPSRAYSIGNSIAALTFILLGLYLCQAGYSLGFLTQNVPGPGFFPAVLGMFLAALGAGVLFGALRNRYPQGDEARLPDSSGVRKIVITTLATAILLLTIEGLGYQIVMTGYIFVLLVTVGNVPRMRGLIASVLFGFVSFFAVTAGLGLTLPTANIGILRNLGL